MKELIFTYDVRKDGDGGEAAYALKVDEFCANQLLHLDELNGRDRFELMRYIIEPMIFSVEHLRGVSSSPEQSRTFGRCVMFKQIDGAMLENLRKQFPAGTRVELVRMDDVQAPEPGTTGTVIGVDEIGSIMVRWDNGSNLFVLYGMDVCRKC